MTAQVKRHSADYDPTARLTRSELVADIDAAEDVIKRFFKVSMKDKRAFAAWVSLPIRSR
jgi:hypothetical protein